MTCFYQWTVVGRRGMSGQSVHQVVHTDVEHAHAQAPPLSTAAPVAMVIISRRCYVAAHVLVCLRILSSRLDFSSFNNMISVLYSVWLRVARNECYLLTYVRTYLKCLLSDRGTFFVDISTRSVQGFGSLRWPKIAISHWLEESPLQ